MAQNIAGRIEVEVSALCFSRVHSAFPLRGTDGGTGDGEGY